MNDHGVDRGPLGILACAGSLPVEIAQAARSDGRAVHIVGIEGFAEPEITAYSHKVVSIGQIAGILSSLRRAGCRQLVIAGALRRPNLLKLRVDQGFFRAIRTALSLTRGGDDSVLRRVVRFFEREGFEVVGVGDVAPHLLASAGAFGRVTPSPAHTRAIARASALLRALGAFDIGQGAVATDDRIIAVEGVRGTDAMLEQVRAWQAEMRARNVTDAATGVDLDGAVLVKLPKPGQEMRVDLPAIGPRTVENAHACGIAGIVVASGRALVLERSRMIALADQQGLFVAGIDDVGPSATITDAPIDEAAPLLFHPLGWHRAKAGERNDIAIGSKVLSIVTAHEAGRAVAVVGEHVQGIDAGFGARRLLGSLGRSSHWGLRVFKRRIGALVVSTIEDIGADGAEIEATLDAIVGAGLAGVAVVMGDVNSPLAALLKEHAGRRGLFALVAQQRERT